MPTNFFFPGKGGVPHNRSVSTQSGTGQATAATGIAHKAGVINRIAYFVSALSSPAPVYRGRLESIASNYVPSNVILAAGREGTTQPGSTGWHTITLGTPYNVSQGEQLAWTLFYDSGAIGVGNNFTVSQLLYVSNIGFVGAQQYGIPNAFNSSSYPVWANRNSHTALLCLYSDDDMIYPGYPVDGLTHTTIPTSGVNSRFGNAFTADFSAMCMGVELAARLDGGFVVELLDSSNNVLASSSGSGRRNVSGVYNHIYFATPARLQEGSRYRLIVRCTSATVNILTWSNCYSAAAMAWRFGDFCQTTSSDGVTYTDNTTALASIGPLVASPIGFYMPFKNPVFGAE